MHRRSFLQASAAVAVTGPTLLGMTDKAGAKPPTVGDKGHVYECHHGWGTLPAGFEWQTTHNVAVDAAGLVYITHQGIGKKEDTVLVFDAAGTFDVDALVRAASMTAAVWTASRGATGMLAAGLSLPSAAATAR